MLHEGGLESALEQVLHGKVPCEIGTHRFAGARSVVQADAAVADDRVLSLFARPPGAVAVHRQVAFPNRGGWGYNDLVDLAHRCHAIKNRG